MVDQDRQVQELSHAIVEVGRRLYDKGLLSASDGNISVRLSDDRLLITPSGLHKGFLKPEQIIVVGADGQVVSTETSSTPGLRPSSEIMMHWEAYRQRPDVGAVIHAHPPAAVACSVAGISLADPVLPEIIYHLGAIPTIPYATPAGPASAEAIRTWVRDHDALILSHHGTLTLGANLEQAFIRTEQVEHAAWIVLLAHMAGNVTPLPADEVARLQALRQRLHF